MWKYVTRGIRQTLERRARCPQILPQSSQDGSTSSEVKTPNFFSHQKIFPQSLSAFGNEFFGNLKTKTKPKREQSKWEQKYDWIDAVGWSSILAIGWVVYQTIFIHRKLFEKEKNTGFKSWKKSFSMPAQVHITRLLSHLVIPEPRYGLPVTNQPVVHAGTEQISEYTSEATHPYGPVTVEEALAEAVDKFSETHQLLTREVQFSFGNEAMKEKRYNDAIKHYAEGAKMADAGSMYNLALCHQLGLGTAIDYIKAVRYYADAAEMGHPDALYNLGVFHAQGRGGLSMNLVKAKQLFVKAASLGQIQAQKALLMEKNVKKTEELKEKTEDLKEKVENENRKRNLIMQFIKYRRNANSIDSDNCTNSSKLSLDARKSPKDMLLEVFGIPERNSIALITVGDSGY